MNEFEIGLHACTVIRTGLFAFTVFPRGYRGSHTLELVQVDHPDGSQTFAAYWDGVPFNTDGVLGLWDLHDLSVGESRTYDDEDL